MAGTTRTPASSGFSLIELLVVIAILAVLISILLPALGAVRARGWAIGCASNMRQLAIGHAHYANDFDGISLPGRFAKVDPATDPANHYEVGNGMHYRPRWMVSMGAAAGFFAYTEPSTDPSKENDNNRLLEASIFADPAVPTFINNRNYAYGYNFQFLGNTRTNARGGLVNFPVRLHALNTQTVLFADALGTAATFRQTDRLPYNPRPHPDNDPRQIANHGWSLDPPRLTSDSDNCTGNRDGVTRSAPAERHAGTANVAWLDGHVSTETASQLGYIEDGLGRFAYDDDRATNRLFSGTGADADPPSVN